MPDFYCKNVEDYHNTAFHPYVTHSLHGKPDDLHQDRYHSHDDRRDQASGHQQSHDIVLKEPVVNAGPLVKATHGGKTLPGSWPAELSKLQS